MSLHVPTKVAPMPGRPNDTGQGLSHDALNGLHQEQQRFSRYFGGFQETTITDAAGKTVTVLAKQAGDAGVMSPWYVEFRTGGIFISVPYCTFPGNDPSWTIDGNPVDFITYTNNTLDFEGRKLIVLELTVDDTSPVQIYITAVKIKAMAESDPLTNTATKRYIALRGVDRPRSEMSPSYLSGAIQVRRWGNRNDVNNLIWQVT